MKVLLVDDQSHVRRLLHYTLYRLKHKLFMAEDGESALTVCRRVKPDIVILDVMLPGGIDGLQVCRTIKAEAAYPLMVIFVSARSQQSDIDAGYAAGGDAYIVKPFSPIELARQVQAFTEALKEMPSQGRDAKASGTDIASVESRMERRAWQCESITR